MDSHLEPPSPAPSPDMLGLDQMIRHNDAGVFPDPGTMAKKAASATPQTHTYYDDSPAYHGAADIEKTTLACSFHTEVAYMQPRPYTTPETSPPIVTQSHASQKTRTTRVSRLGEANSTRPKGNRVSKPTSKKRKELERARMGKQNRPFRIQRPLSELAREYPGVVIADIATYVQRPTEVRLQEVARDKKDPGKIKRPMNCFMLYRKAYQNLAKVLSENHHNVISQVVGDGWDVEPEHFKQQFRDWAKIENENHHHAYPSYKFAPAKSEQKAKKRRAGSEDRSALGDPDWLLERHAKSNRENIRHGLAAGAEAMPASIFGPFHPHGSPDPAMLHTSAPPPHQYPTMGEACSPQPYGNTNVAGAQYYQQHTHPPTTGRSALVGDIVIRGTPSSAAYGGEQDARHGRPSQYPPIAHHAVPEQVVDPSLVTGPDGTRYDDFYGGFGLDTDRQWQGHEVPDTGASVLQEDSMAPLDNILAQDPQLDYLRGNEGSWQLEDIGEKRHQFDGWAA